jgi:signal peptide peptidase SppA
MSELEQTNNAVNISSTVFFSLMSMGLLCMLCMCNCLKRSSKIKNNVIDSRGLNNKFNIIKYNYNEDPDINEYSKYKKDLIKKNTVKEQNDNSKNYFIFRFDNLSKMTKEYYKINKNSDEFDNLVKFVNFIIRTGDNTKDEVIIIISSPGGYAFEFEEAYTQLSRLKKNGFRSVALIDKICASGGYMLACACDKIICSETSMIGSVGVIGQSMNYKELADKLGIKFFRFTTGKYKGGFPTSTEYNDSDIELTKEDIEKTLNVFKSIVTNARPNIHIDTVLSAKVWYGVQALEQGLVDELKVLDDYIIDIEKENNSIYYVNPENKRESILDNLGNIIEHDKNKFKTLLNTFNSESFLNIKM